MNLHRLTSLHYSNELILKSTINRKTNKGYCVSVGEASHMYLQLIEQGRDTQANKFLKDLKELGF